MVPFISRWLRPCALPAALLAGLCGSALTAQAQALAPAARPDPLDAKASVPTLAYESPFSRYRPWGDEKPVSWREANDTVTRIGGWRVYAREAQQPDPGAAAAPAAPAARSAPAAPAAPAAPLANPPLKAPEAAMPAEMAKPMPMPAGHGGHKAP